MSTFQKADQETMDLAAEVLCAFATHKPLLDAKVKIDLVFAYGSRTESGMLTSHALTHRGVRALGLASKLKLKDRAMGRGDAEVALDHDWWEEASDLQRRALLDHELHHVSVKTDKLGRFQYDDLRRPVLVLRRHDFEFGWFRIVAERHGPFSIERLQAKNMMDEAMQSFWPEMFEDKAKG